MKKELLRYLPKYSELSTIGSTGEHHSWGVFGAGDELGMVNLLTPEGVKRAASLVRKGTVFNLCLPLDQPYPSVAPRRHPYERKTKVFPNYRDDRLDNLYPQYSTHWDALGHARYEQLGLHYGGLGDDEVDKGKLGIDKWVEHGMVGRGLLIDVARHREEQGIPFDPAEAWGIKSRDLEAIAKKQGVQFGVGDILLLRTGWMKHYLGLDPAGREAFALALQSRYVSPGLEGTREMAAFLWDNGVAAVAADNISVEKVPPIEPTLHILVLCLLGMPLGEFWNLEALATDCAQDSVYECLVASAPLNLRGGYGSPANAIAVK